MSQECILGQHFPRFVEQSLFCGMMVLQQMLLCLFKTFEKNKPALTGRKYYPVNGQPRLQKSGKSHEKYLHVPLFVHFNAFYYYAKDQDDSLRAFLAALHIQHVMTP